MEMIVSGVIVLLARFIEDTSVDDRLRIHRVRTCHVERYRVEGGEHAHVRHDREIVFRVTVAVRGNIDH